jgi:hypothetical protein
MPFTQQTFLGASISSFTANLGWGTQESTLSVRLVEDPANNDAFTPGPIGGPVFFEYDGWEFNGILRNYRKTSGTEGFIYQAQVTDPRSILDGVQLILDNYQSSVYRVPNLFNIYGYLENTGFGNSLSNDSGMPWYKIRDTLVYLTNTPSVDYGGPIQLRNAVYVIDLTELPILPNYFRISGEAISILGFINEVCEAASHDFFITLDLAPRYELINGVQTMTGYNNAIKLHTINRSNPSQTGRITDFVNSTDGAKATEVGLELRNEYTGKFVTGGQKKGVYFFEPTGVLRKYWGEYTDTNDLVREEPVEWAHHVNPAFVGNVPGLGAGWQILSSGVKVEAYKLQVPGATASTTQADTNEYILNYDELRYAAENRESWEAYLWLRKDILEKTLARADLGLRSPPYVWTSPKGTVISADVDNIISPYYTCHKFLSSSPGGYSYNPSPGFSRAVAARIISNSNYEAIGKLIEEKSAAAPPSHTLPKRPIVQYGNLGQIDNEDLDEGHTRLYEFVKDLSNDLGRKYLVPLDFVDTVVEPDTLVIKTTWEPTDAGFLSSGDMEDAVDNGYLPESNEFQLQTVDNRFVAYAKFENAHNLDFSEVSSEDILYPGAGSLSQTNPDAEAYVLCDVDPAIRYLDYSAKSGPHAVVTLRGAVRLRTGDKTDDKAAQKATEEFIDGTTKAHRKTRTAFGTDVNDIGKLGAPVQPNLVAIPMQNNQATYGPWYAVGSNGKCNFEQDETLVPWNYNGYPHMDSVGYSKVVQALSNMQEGENGTVEYPGAPAITLGDTLITGGPYVTDVDVSIGTEGVTTKYMMNTWTPRFGSMAKATANQISTLSKRTQHLQRQQAKRTSAYTESSWNHLYNNRRTKSSRKKLTTTSHMLVGENFEIAESGIYMPNVGIQPFKNMINQLGDVQDYQEKGGMSVDGLIRPFSTTTEEDSSTRFIYYTNASGVKNSGALTGDQEYFSLPHYETPTDEAASPTLTDLNPFKTDMWFGHDVSMVVKDNEYPEDFSTRYGGYSDNNRPMALRGPITIVGWGYDTNGYPTPNSGILAGEGANNVFESGYLQRSHLWKVGPLDTRWDNDRKVWVAGGGSDIKEGRLLGDLEAPNNWNTPTSGVLDVWSNNNAGQSMDDTAENQIFYNRDTTFSLSSGTYLSIISYGKEYRQLWAACED